ncbi:MULTISPECIES: SDR family NAD(P)-dependent oxidoreductase [Mycobacteriaceae]|uniref:SDR family NAD(P)-dependent oxidoreductase n=1 Tax=Mycobacteriaceae TaxID=1762 RepID=UPI0007FC4627|nr:MULTISPECIES: SDR family NAD(P)-dependent oxidoreductase [Mycobacteriaceae]MCK0175669.1 SDR family NAD(P)-dependent oxidoreductase [Mycolicibacterium sp. F2034L]OBB58642.1 short-chain dehydrogenase [Mycobacterium sp. 852013-51886_SCH5428379]
MTKWTAADVPDQEDRVAVITGANTGIGYEAAAVLAAKGAHVVLAVRNTDKGHRAAERIRAATPHADVTVRELDLTSLDSIRRAADDLRAEYPRIDLLINNAGVMMTPKATTKDGFELQFGTNHLGHFALTGQLLDNLLPVEGSRVVTISSNAHRFGGMNFDDLQSERKYNRVTAYGQSKLSNLLFTYELDRRLTAKGAPTIAVAAHPGTSSTELTRNLWPVARKPVELVWGLISQTPEMGALPTLRAATDPQVRGGQYYGPSDLNEQRGYPKLVQSNGRSHDEAAQRRLWAVSEELTGVTFPV